MRDLSPLPPTLANLEALSEDAWRALRDLAAVAEEGARMFEEIAQNFRSVVDYVKAAEEKRSASLEAQAEIVTALFAAIRETDSRFRSLSVAEVIGKFQLALATPAGPRES